MGDIQTFWEVCWNGRSSLDPGRQSRNVRFGLDFVDLAPDSGLAQVFGSDAPGLPAVSSAGWRAQASR